MSEPTPSSDELFDLLLAWEDKAKRGEDISPAELCGNRAGLIPLLQSSIEQLKRMQWLDQALGQELDLSGVRSVPSELLGGRYRLDAFIGEGGFGEVWRGYDTTLERAVAVKLPRRGRSWIMGEVEGLMGEAKKAARLSHPGIVQVFDVGTHGETCFIVSELIAGVDLGQKMSSSWVGPREALRIAIDVADALRHAHQQGVLHLDVKPGNILISQVGRVLLTDFGIALASSDNPDAALGRGTPAYMAPEQRTGSVQNVGVTTDLFSLAVVVHEVLAKSRPTTSGPRGLAVLAKGIPRSLVPVLNKCLSPLPADRYLSAVDFVDALRSAASKLLTEDEWTTCSDPVRMLAHINETSRDLRKVRLFACACARRHWPSLTDEKSRRAVEVSEQFADTCQDQETYHLAEVSSESPELTALEAANSAAWSVAQGDTSAAGQAAWAADSNAWTAAVNVSRHLLAHEVCQVWRDLFGPDLFQPPPERAWLKHADQAVEIARNMYDKGEFGSMRLLVEALESAGCDEASIYEHCLIGRHFRGCWVIDLLRGHVAQS
jgi:serine/threonine protein kinase